MKVIPDEQYLSSNYFDKLYTQAYTFQFSVTEYILEELKIWSQFDGNDSLTVSRFETRLKVETKRGLI